MASVSNKSLPPMVDLRSFMKPPKDQGMLNANVAHPVATACEFLIMKSGKKSVDISRLFIYYNARVIDGSNEHSMRDQGCTVTSAIESLKQYGICEETFFPYSAASVNQKPPEPCYTEAKKYRLKDSVHLDIDLNEMKACLAEGYPFIFGLKVFPEFVGAGTNGGRVSTPKSFEQQRPNAIAMLAVGYIDSSQVFIVQSSWGPEWGDHGYCYIPYDYMCDPKFCISIYVIKSIEQN